MRICGSEGGSDNEPVYPLPIERPDSFDLNLVGLTSVHENNVVPSPSQGVRYPAHTEPEERILDVPDDNADGV